MGVKDPGYLRSVSATVALINVLVSIPLLLLIALWSSKVELWFFATTAMVQFSASLVVYNVFRFFIGDAPKNDRWVGGLTGIVMFILLLFWIQSNGSLQSPGRPWPFPFFPYAIALLIGGWPAWKAGQFAVDFARNRTW